MVAPEHKRLSTRATGVVGIAILSSRILGLIREQIFAALFGAGNYLDAFLMAFRLPNLLRDLFAEGAFPPLSSPLSQEKLPPKVTSRLGDWPTR